MYKLMITGSSAKINVSLTYLLCFMVISEVAMAGYDLAADGAILLTRCNWGSAGEVRG